MTCPLPLLSFLDSSEATGRVPHDVPATQMLQFFLPPAPHALLLTDLIDASSLFGVQPQSTPLGRRG